VRAGLSDAGAFDAVFGVRATAALWIAAESFVELDVGGTLAGLAGVLAAVSELARAVGAALDACAAGSGVADCASDCVPRVAAAAAGVMAVAAAGLRVLAASASPLAAAEPVGDARSRAAPAVATVVVDERSRPLFGRAWPRCGALTGRAGAFTELAAA
jgi:hypothetical protein